MLKFLDLYCGIGGLSFGFAYAFKDAQIFGLDIDEKAVETYNLNLSRFNCKAEVQDVLEWKPEGHYDIIFGGSPCQPFSVANTKKKGDKHELFPTLSRFFDVVQELKPKAFLLENVKGIVSQKFRPHLELQLKKVRDTYVLDYKILNSALYGVPQQRKRFIMIGIRSDLGKRPKFPEETHSEKEGVNVYGNKLERWVTLKEAIGDLLETTPIIVTRKIKQTAYQNKHPPLSLEKPSRAVSSHFAKTSRDALVPIPDHLLLEKGGLVSEKSSWGSRVMELEKPSFTITEKHRSGQLVPISENYGTSYKVKLNNYIGNSALNWGVPSFTILGGSGAGGPIPPPHPNTFRRLTVRECMRIQSFPDWWVFSEDVSVSKKYKLVGEAVPPILAYRLAVALGEVLGLEVNLNPKKEIWQLPYFEKSFKRVYVN